MIQIGAEQLSTKSGRVHVRDHLRSWGAGAMACTVLIKADLIATLHSEAAAVFFGLFLECFVLTGGVIVIALGIRLLKGVFRSNHQSL